VTPCDPSSGTRVAPLPCLRRARRILPAGTVPRVVFARSRDRDDVSALRAHARRRPLRQARLRLRRLLGAGAAVCRPAVFWAPGLRVPGRRAARKPTHQREAPDRVYDCRCELPSCTETSRVRTTWRRTSRPATSVFPVIAVFTDVSVCLSVCLSYARVLPKPLDGSSCRLSFFHLYYAEFYKIKVLSSGNLT